MGGVGLDFVQYFVQGPQRISLSPEMKLQTNTALLGAGFMASAAAIDNLFTIERSFRHPLRASGFNHPGRKFWGVKILVSLAFMQKLLFMLPLPVISQMSNSQSALCYSSMLCMECFIVSLWHNIAWRSGEKWYEEWIPTYCEDSMLTFLS